MATGIRALLRISLAHFNGKASVYERRLQLRHSVATEEFGETCRSSRYDAHYCLQSKVILIIAPCLLFDFVITSWPRASGHFYNILPASRSPSSQANVKGEPRETLKHQTMRDQSSLATVIWNVKALQSKRLHWRPTLFLGNASLQRAFPAD